jgi:hypothetical protein
VLLLGISAIAGITTAPVIEISVFIANEPIVGVPAPIIARTAVGRAAAAVTVLGFRDPDSKRGSGKGDKKAEAGDQPQKNEQTLHVLFTSQFTVFTCQVMPPNPKI